MTTDQWGLLGTFVLLYCCCKDGVECIEKEHTAEKRMEPNQINRNLLYG